MPTSDSEALRYQLSEAAWAQWTSLGVLGATPMRESRCIDPEALTWLTFAGGVDDGRLIDTARDWLALNAHLISVHRLRNVFGDEGAPLETVKSALGGNRDRPTPRFKTAAKAVVADPTPPANLAVRLRLLFDAGVRAEVIRFLVTRQSHGEDAQTVADAAMFAKRNVSDTLLSLVRAGVAEEAWAGNRRVFSIDERRWCAFIGIDLEDVPIYAPWTKVFDVAMALVDWLEADDRATESTYLRASSARSLVTRLQQKLVACGIDMRSFDGFIAEEFLIPFDELVGRIAEIAAPQQVVEPHTD